MRLIISLFIFNIIILSVYGSTYKPLDCSRLTYKECLREKDLCSPSFGDKCCDDEKVFKCIPSEHCDPIDDLPAPRTWCVEYSRHSFIRYNSTCFSHPDRDYFLPNAKKCSEVDCPTGFYCRDYSKKDKNECHSTSDNVCCSFQSKCLPRDSGARPSVKPMFIDPEQAKKINIVDDGIDIGQSAKPEPVTCALILCQPDEKCVEATAKSAAHCVKVISAPRPIRDVSVSESNEKPVSPPVDLSSSSSSSTTTPSEEKKPTEECECPEGTTCVKSEEGEVKCIENTPKKLPTKKPIQSTRPSKLETVDEENQPPKNKKSCETLICVKGFECVEDDEYGARCKLAPKPTPPPTVEPKRTPGDCNTTECVWGWSCKETETGPRCIPPPTRPSCLNIKCGELGTCLTDDLGGGHCVPKSNCSKIQCGGNQICVDDNETNTPKCMTKEQIVGCSQIRCKNGNECVEDPKTGGRCVPSIWCNRVKCAAYYKCQNGASGAECVPMANCTTTKCPKGKHCEDDPDLGAHCRENSRITCSVVLCNKGYHCVEGEDGRDPTCVANPTKVTCDTIRCQQGYHCVDSGVGPECIVNPTCAESLCKPGTYCVDDPLLGAICKNATKVATCETLDCRDGYICIDGINGTEATCVKKKNITNSCDNVQCQEGTICVDDKENGNGVLCVPMDSCYFTICPTNFDCIENEKGKGICTRRSCATLKCAYPYVCMTPKVGVPECVLMKR